MVYKILCSFILLSGLLNNAVFSQPREAIILNHKDKIKIKKLDTLNSAYRETNLSVSPDDKYLYFMSDRGGMPWSSAGYGLYKGRPRFDGDIWYSVKKNNEWQKPIALSNKVNTSSGEDEPTISADGKTVTYQSWKFDWEETGGPYYSANFQGADWGQAFGLGQGIALFFRNQFKIYNRFATDGMAISANRKIFLVACGPDYDKNMDILISFKTDSGWSYLKKLPLSTKQDERSVFIAGDNKTIFFASNGYGGFGGMDIFKTTINEDGTNGDIYNIGEPFNTKNDDFGFIVTGDGNTAYFVRDDDIYYADLHNADNRIKPDTTIVKIREEKKEITKKQDIKNNIIILFDFDKSEVKPEFKTKLDSLAEYLLKNNIQKIELKGHTDSKGSDDYNINLGNRRIIAVKNYLINKGVKKTVFAPESFGEKIPVSDEKTDEGAYQNRRVEIIIY